MNINLFMKLLIYYINIKNYIDEHILHNNIQF